MFFELKLHYFTRFSKLNFTSLKLQENCLQVHFFLESGNSKTGIVPGKKGQLAGMSGRFDNFAYKVLGFQTGLLNMPIHLKTTLPLWKTYGKSSTGGVCASNGITH